MKKCFVDLETTGLEPWVEDELEVNRKGVILSAGFALEDRRELEVIITPTPEEWGHASPRALEVNGMDWDFLKENGIPFVDAISVILKWFEENNVTREDWVFVAQNSKFDKKFLVHFIGEWLEFVNGPTVWVDTIPIFKDVGRKAGLNVRYQNTHHMSQQLGVPEEPKPHQAIEGARAVRRNYDAMKKLAKEKDIKWLKHYG